MAATGTSISPAPGAAAEPLQIVLFGMPAAGKTSLLGALAQAAQSQEHLLHGRLTDPSHGLAEIQHRLYADKPRRTTEEIVPYAIRFEPFAATPDEAADETLDAVLIDCDGQVANDLLTRRKELSEASPEGSLAREVLDADTVVLVVDASAPPAQVEADFVEFGRFLRLFERQRGRQIEVGGLPVFLVLTKCDLLAKPEDTPSDWMEHIEERKRQVSERFQAFLTRDTDENGPLGFGDIDLHLWATAVKRPALAGVPAKPNEPYGVAELFWQSLLNADQFRRRVRRAGRRLAWTLSGVLGVVAVLVVLIVGLSVGHREPRTASTLENRIEAHRTESVAVRLQGSPSEIKLRIAEWAEWRNDPEFGALPVETKHLVGDRIEELKAYSAYWQKLQEQPILPPGRDIDELEKVEEALRTSLALPRPEWGQTDAGKLHDRELEEVRALVKAAAQIEDWYRSRTVTAEKLLLFPERRPEDGAPGINWPAWHGKVNELLSQATKPPMKESEPIPGALTFTYATLLRLNTIVRDREEWERARLRLDRLRDITAALGLGGLLPEKPPVLVVRRTPPFTLSQAEEKLRQLRTAHPHFEQEFSLTGLPDAVLPEIKQAARTQYESLLEPAREEVLGQLRRVGPDSGESPARWNNLLKWLSDPKELAAWRELARVLVLLFDPKRAEPDPVKELEAFLKRESFEIDLRRLSFELPDRLNKRPTGDLTIHITSGEMQIAAQPFEIVDRKREAQRGVTQYQFRAVKPQVLVYKPGDVLWASIPLRDTEKSDEDWTLTWARGRSAVFEFERLARPPRLHRKDQDNTEGKIIDEATLTIIEGSLPAVPDLMPVVKLER
jgi:GTPase SAR1 family protein